MPYTPFDWNTADVITAARLDNLETQYKNPEVRLGNTIPLYSSPDTANATIGAQVDGSNGTKFVINTKTTGGSNADRFAFDGSGRFGLNTTTPSAILHALLNDSQGGSVIEVLRLEKQSTGTVTDGLGGGVSFFVENNAGSSVQCAGLAGLLSSVINGAEIGALQIYTKPSTGPNRAMARFHGSGKTSLGDTTESDPLRVYWSDATSGTVLAMLRLIRETSGTASAGIGASIIFQPENDAGVQVSAAAVSGLLTSVTSAGSAETGAIGFYVRQSGGAFPEVGRIWDDSTMTLGAITQQTAVFYGTKTWTQNTGNRYGGWFISKNNPTSPPSSAFIIGVYGQGYLDAGAGSGGDIIGGRFEGQYGGANTADDVYGVVAEAYNTSTGTVTDARGVSSKVYAQSTAIITSASGFYVFDATKAAGATITTQYGLYMEGQTKGATNWGVYVAANKSYFTNGSNAPLNIPALSANPGSLSNGDLWVFDDGATRALRIRAGGATYSVTLTLT